MTHDEIASAPSVPAPRVGRASSGTPPNPEVAVATSRGPDSVERLLQDLDDGLDAEDFLDSVCRYALMPPGKLFRPWLLLESCAAAGGDPWQAVPAAVGTEFGHVASLVHDDIIDQDDVRRGRMSVQRRFGVDNAIVTGDALLFGLYLRLSQCKERGVSADRVVAALHCVSRAGIELCRGQMGEERLCNNPSATLLDYLDVVRGKTAALFAGACEVGGVLAGGNEQVVGALRTYGENLGVTFQMADDLLAYCSDDSTAGKDLGSDLRNRRMTFPLLVAAESGGDAVREQIMALFSLVDTVEASVLFATAREIIESTDALAECDRQIHHHSSEALAALLRLPRGPSRDRLAEKLAAATARAA